MKEKNKATLKNTIPHLPQYYPPEEIWEGIDRVLTQDQQVQESLSQLPDYNPPAIVWEKIETELTPSPRILRKRWYPLAAAIMLGILATTALLWSFSQKSITYSYAEAELPAFPISDADWHDDDATIAALLTSYQSNPLMTDHPQFNEYQNEYNELMDARGEILQMINRYGMDHDMVRQIKNIELARNEVIQKLVQLF